MMKALLADRFKLAVHVEQREQPVYDLVLARSDGRLGPGIKPSEADCIARAAAQRAVAEAARAAGTLPPPPPRPDFTAGVPPCTMFMTGPRMEGDATMEALARLLRGATGRMVVDKTGLTGSYRLVMEYDRLAAIRGPDAAPTAGSPPPSVFTAVQDQLGLKLEPSKALLDTLIIDRLERPTEN
jgi:uncharacterized protein (TIGR03435 family)